MASVASLPQSGYKFQRDNGWHFAVDSGVTASDFDALMARWSTKYAVVSRAGNHAENVALGASPELLTEPLTRWLMEAAHSNTSPSTWKRPSDIKLLPAFVVTNNIHSGDIEPSPTTDLYPNWYKQ